MNQPKILVIGSGPAGIGAALNLVYDGAKVCLAEAATPGGRFGSTLWAGNLPGQDSPAAVVGAALEQLEQIGCSIISPVDRVYKKGDKPCAQICGVEQVFDAIVIATGKRHNRLGIPGGHILEQAGKLIYWHPSGDVKNKTVYVLGGGNSALQAACWLKENGANVRLMHRRALDLTASYAMLTRFIDCEVMSGQSEVLAYDKAANKLVMCGGEQGKYNIKVPYLMVAMLGTQANNGLVAFASLDEKGLIKTRPDYRVIHSVVPNLFACGSIRSGAVDRGIAAMGDGAACAQHVINTVI